MSRHLQRLIVWLFHVLVILVPFVFTWVNEELFEFNKMIVTYAVASLIGIAWLMRMIVDQKFSVRRTRFDIPIGLFVGSQVLSTIFSIHPYTSFFGYYTRFHGGLLSTLTYVLLYYAFVANVPKAHVPKLFLSFTLAALGVTLYAIPEHFGHSPSCLLITGGQSFDAACWIQDVKNRVFATFGQPNWLAAYTVTLIPLTTVFSFTETMAKNVKIQLGYVATTLMLLITLLFTQSRSGQLGFVVSLLVLLGGLAWLSLRKQLTTVSMKLPASLLIAGMVTIVALFGTNFTPKLSTLFSSGQTPNSVEPVTKVPATNRLEEGGSSSGEIRKIVWSGALKVAQRYPLLGSGVETFAYSYYQDRPMEHNLVSEWDFLYNKAHNEFLNFLATTGVVGLTTYILLLAWFSWVCGKALTNRQLSTATALTLLGMLAGVAGLSVSNFFGFSTVMVSLLLFLYLAITEVLLSSQKNELASSVAAESLTSHQYVGLGISGLIGLYLLWSVMTMWTADTAYTNGKKLLQTGETAAGIEELISAVRQSPQEALFYDELASTYASVAVALAQQGESTTAAEVAQSAIATSSKALELNSRHLNFYKTRARIYITLAALDPKYLIQSAEVLRQALTLAPTDAKLRYNLALVEMASDQEAAGLADLLATIEMKPNYEAARVELAKYYTEKGQLSEATQQYHYILESINPNNQTVKDLLLTLEASASATKP